MSHEIHFLTLDKSVSIVFFFLPHIFVPFSFPQTLNSVGFSTAGLNAVGIAAAENLAK